MDEVYWKHVEELYSGVNKGKDVSKGVAVLREGWEKNKSWLEPYFDEKGQNFTRVSDIGGEDIQNAFQEGYRIAGALCADTKHRKSKYKLIGQVDNGYQIVRWLKNQVGPDHTGRLFSLSEFANNKLDEKMPYPGKESKSLPKGTKVTKAIQLTIAEDETLWAENSSFARYGVENKEMVVEFAIDVVSQVISLLKVSGTFAVISINPIDIMLAGGHNNGAWNSCHNVFGTWWATYAASMIVDPGMIMAFASKNSDIIEHTTLVWPKRLWRAIINIDEKNKSFLFSSQYPNANSIYLEPSVEMAQKMLAKHYGQPCEIERTNFNYNTMGFKNAYWTHTNDPLFAVRFKDGGTFPKTMVGGSEEIPCLLCGTIRTSKNDSGTGEHLCLSCRGQKKCRECGCTRNADQVKERKNGTIMCDNCYSQKYFDCPDCGKTVKRDSTTTLLVDPGRINRTICSECANKYPKCSHCGYRVVPEHALKLEGTARIYCDRCYRAYYSTKEAKPYVDMQTGVLS